MGVGFIGYELKVENKKVFLFCCFKIKIKYDTTFNCKINWFLTSEICGLDKVVSELFRSIFEYLYGGATGTRKN